MKPTVLKTPSTLWPVSRTNAGTSSLTVPSTGPAPITLSSAAPAGAAANTSATAIESATAMRRNMAPSYPVLRPIELRLSTSAANKESDNLYRRGRRSVGHHAIELFVKSDHAPLQDASLRQLGSAALRSEALRPRMIAIPNEAITRLHRSPTRCAT